MNTKESNYVSLKSAQKKQRPTSRRPVVISYAEATNLRPKSTSPPRTTTPYRRRPHNAKPYMAESPSLESRYQTQYSPETSTTKSGSAGYRGGINPVFVSLNERENVAIRSKIPTPPPRNYFPVRKSQTNNDQKDIYDEITEKIYPADNYVYNGFYKDKIDEITTESYSTYSPPYDVTRPSSDQWSFWETQSTTRRPPPTFDSSNIWPEYSKVVNDLLQDEGSRYQGTDSDRHPSQYQFQCFHNNIPDFRKTLD